MTSGNGAEPSGEEPAVAGPTGEDPALGPGSPEESTGDSGDGEDTIADPAQAAGSERPRRFRRKAGVEYRPV